MGRLVSQLGTPQVQLQFFSGLSLFLAKFVVFLTQPILNTWRGGGRLDFETCSQCFKAIY